MWVMACSAPNLCAKPILVCSAIACQAVVTRASVHPMVPQEARRGIGAVDFEPLIAVGVLGDTKVMQHAAEEYQLVVIVDTRSQPLGGGELATV